MPTAHALKLEAETPVLPPSFATVRDATNAIKDRSPAPFRRALLLLRGTHSQVVLFQVNFWGQVSDECGTLLNRLFGQDAMIEQTDDSTYVMLFVRRRDDESSIEGQVMHKLAQSMQPAFGRRFHATLTSLRHDSETIGDFEDLVAQLAVEGSKGAKIVTI